MFILFFYAYFSWLATKTKPKALEISILITNAKTFIRASYPDEEQNNEEQSESNEVIGGDSEVGEEQFGDEITEDEEDPLLNVELEGDLSDDEEISDEIDSMGDID